MGDDERAKGVVTIKPLRGQGGLIQQEAVQQSDAAAVIRQALKFSSNLI
jgi:hypothetical protein